MDAFAHTDTLQDLGQDLDQLALRIDRHGLAGLRAGDLDRLALTAARAGVPTPVVEALLDPSAPEVVRQRAFGRIYRLVAADPRPAVVLAA